MFIIMQFTMINNMYPRAGESIITRTMCPQSNMEMVLSCRREHHFQDNICQHSITCYIAAGCYVNCVLGYDKIRYANMLYVLSCTFLQQINI